MNDWWTLKNGVMLRFCFEFDSNNQMIKWKKNFIKRERERINVILIIWGSNVFIKYSLYLYNYNFPAITCIWLTWSAYNLDFIKVYLHIKGTDIAKEIRYFKTANTDRELPIQLWWNWSFLYSSLFFLCGNCTWLTRFWW